MRPAERLVPETLARWTSLLVLLVALGGWELSARSGLVSPLFYPPPSAIGRTLLRLVASGELIANLASSVTRIVVGFACGGGVALVLGLGMGWSRRLRLAIDPLVAAAHPVPRLALLPLVLLLFGLGETSRLIVIAISAFFPVLINTSAGVRQLESIHFEVARNFGARPAQVFAHVVWPASLPSLVTGARLGLVAALRTTLAIELITAERGLGHMLWLSWETFRTEQLYATLFAIAALGFAMNVALERAAAWLMPWRPERS